MLSPSFVVACALSVLVPGCTDEDPAAAGVDGSPAVVDANAGNAGTSSDSDPDQADADDLELEGHDVNVEVNPSDYRAADGQITIRFHVPDLPGRIEDATLELIPSGPAAENILVHAPEAQAAGVALARTAQQGDADMVGPLEVTEEGVAGIDLTGLVHPDSDLSLALTGEAGALEALSSDVTESQPVLRVRTRVPIEHIIIVVKENHTFDNYFGSFPGANGTTHWKARHRHGTAPRVPRRLSQRRDLSHKHSCALADWNHGKNNGWDDCDKKNRSDDLAYAQYRKSDIPNYWAYARRYTLADNYHASILGPSHPDHLFTLAAQGFGTVDNPKKGGCNNPHSTVHVLDHQTCRTKQVHACFKGKAVVQLLPHKVTWKIYGPQTGINIRSLYRRSDYHKHMARADRLFDDIKNGHLPNVVYVRPSPSEHPPQAVCPGENWTVRLMNTLMRSKYWKSSAVLVTYDDFGGWYDHVPPAQHYGCKGEKDTRPYGMGFRVPLMVVSPWAKPHFVYSRLAAHQSLPKLIEALWGLRSLHSTDSRARDGKGTRNLLGVFDFESPPRARMIRARRNCSGER